MTAIQFAELIIGSSIEQQKAFYEALKYELSGDDFLTTVKFIAFHSIFTDPEKYNAIKQACCDVMVEELYGRKTEWRG